MDKDNIFSVENSGCFENIIDGIAEEQCAADDGAGGRGGTR